MSVTDRRRSGFRRIPFGLLVTGLLITMVGCKSPRQSTRQRSEQTVVVQPSPKQLGESGEVFLVDPGDEDDAYLYYFATFCELGLTTDALCTATPTPNLNQKKLAVTSRGLDLAQTLQFLGYSTLTPRELEDTGSKELTSRFPNDLLSTAFFAPKITDVSQSLNDGGNQRINIGWRKLIRLKALDGSPAQQKGVAAGFLLFNKFQGTNYSENPFRPADRDNESKATQLILIRADASTLRRPVYFFVFGPLSEQSKLITFLTATFDARAPNIVANNRYYVPHACAECHGATIHDVNKDAQYERLKLNYLDTDHWFDRLDDDFTAIKTMKDFGVLFDGGKVLADGGDKETTPQFEDAFQIIRLLNMEIRAQNSKVEPPLGSVPPTFQLRAVNKWLELHASDTSHKNVFARTLPNPSGPQWSASTVPDKTLLPLLNQYCFRCHSSLKYSIFDRPEVVRRALSLNGKSIVERLHTPVADPLRMPQDRNLDCAQKWRDDKQRMHELVCGLKPDIPCPTPTPLVPCLMPSPTPP